MKQINMAKASKRDQKDAENEAQILKSLAHRYVVKYYDSFLDSGKLNIVMEYCAGGR
jgi:NIMA (never in mitosis gene a)-related kinase